MTIDTPWSRVEAKLAKEQDGTGCWIWLGSKNAGGYGRTWYVDRLWFVHRLTYTLWHGPIPPKLVIDHLCRVPSCANPAHLEAVTDGENTRRGLQGFELTGKCRSGKHDVTIEGATTIISRKRVCVQCKPDNRREYMRAWYAAHSEQVTAKQRARRQAAKAEGGFA